MIEIRDDTHCIDCAKDTLPTDSGRAEWYMVHDHIWTQAGMSPDGGGCLCIGCLETRTGRRLQRSDFAPMKLNDLSMADIPRYAWTYRSTRLTRRLTRGGRQPRNRTT